jgi:precorrin-6B methylase 2
MEFPVSQELFDPDRKLAFTPKWVRAEIIKHWNTQGTLLDLGSGTGSVAWDWCMLHTDNSAISIEIDHIRWQKLHDHKQKPVRLFSKLYDVNQLVFEAKSVDAVFLGCPSYVNLETMHRVCDACKPNAIMICTHEIRFPPAILESTSFAKLFDITQNYVIVNNGDNSRRLLVFKIR